MFQTALDGIIFFGFFGVLDGFDNNPEADAGCANHALCG